MAYCRQRKGGHRGPSVTEWSSVTDRSRQTLCVARFESELCPPSFGSVDRSPSFNYSSLKMGITLPGVVAKCRIVHSK